MGGTDATLAISVVCHDVQIRVENVTDSEGIIVSFHKIPEDGKLKILWLDLIRRNVIIDKIRVGKQVPFTSKPSTRNIYPLSLSLSLSLSHSLLITESVNITQVNSYFLYHFVFKSFYNVNTVCFGHIKL